MRRAYHQPARRMDENLFISDRDWDVPTSIHLDGAMTRLAFRSPVPKIAFRHRRTHKPAMTGLLSAWREWRERREILHDIRRRQADQKERDHFLARDLLAEALAAIALNDRRKATTIWNSVVERYPMQIRTSPLALDLLLKLGRYDEAEALMRDGRKKHPREIFFAKGLGAVAHQRGDDDAANEYYAALRKQWPGEAQGYVLGAQSLARKNRTAEAEALAQQTMKQFPEEIGGFLAYARLASSAEDWLEAMRRWQIVQDAFPQRAFGYYGRAQALIGLGRYDEADEVLEEGRSKFPTESGWYAERARCAQLRGDFPEAVKRWKHRIERMPMEMHGYYNAANALQEMGEYVEAEAILREAIDRFPVEDGPLITLAKFLHERQDYSAEAAAWAALRQIFADNDESYTRGADALRRSGHPDQADALMEEHKSRFNA
jgi:predicted Zn-dependent protease